MTSSPVSPETFIRWQDVAGIDSVASPALLVDVDRVSANLRRMRTVVEEQPRRLRPHVKTHKMSAVVQQYRELGIEQFKTATIAEAEMVATAGGRDCLLAHQPVGKKIEQLGELVTAFPQTRFSTIVDNPATVERLNEFFAKHPGTLDLWIDVDCGMHRTGVPFGDSLQAIRKQITELTHVMYRGLHVYDGHLHQSSLTARSAQLQSIFQAIKADLREHPSPAVVVGGSPTFEIWASQTSAVESTTAWQCSPGTMVFWDQGYADLFREMQYEIAAALLTRVISKPGSDLVCLDLGHKSVASEMSLEQRVRLPSLPDARLVSHSEEHLVVQTAAAHTLSVGDAVIALPRHICPTVALHAEAHLIRDGRVSGECWRIDGKNR